MGTGEACAFCCSNRHTELRSPNVTVSPDLSRAAAPRAVRLPGLRAGRLIGLGDVIGRLTSALGVRPCGGCAGRAAALNSRLVFMGREPMRMLSSASPPAPKPGCWFAGTSCYGFVQTLKFCCGDGTEYTQRWGWCIGLWFAPPCRPR